MPTMPTRRAKSPTTKQSTEANRPKSFPDNPTPAMRRLCDLRELTYYIIDLNAQWHELVGLAKLEGHPTKHIAWASSRPRQLTRISKAVRKTKIDPSQAIRPVTRPTEGIKVPNRLQHFPDHTDLNEIIAGDPGRFVPLPEIERTDFAIRSTEDNRPEGIVLTPVMERIISVSDLMHAIADLPIADQSIQLAIHADSEGNKTDAIVWAWGAPSQRSYLYTLLPERGHRYNLTSEERNTITEKPLPEELRSLPGLKDVADMLSADS